jgi:hypothetical protein
LRLRWLGSDQLTWRDLLVVVKHAQPGSAIAANVDARMSWTPDQYLLASTVDALNLLLWAKTKDAQTGRNKPNPIPRPHKAMPAQMPKANIRELLARPRR